MKDLALFVNLTLTLFAIVVLGLYAGVLYFIVSKRISADLARFYHEMIGLTVMSLNTPSLYNWGTIGLFSVLLVSQGFYSFAVCMTILYTGIVLFYLLYKPTSKTK